MTPNRLKNNVDLVLSFDDYHEGNLKIAERLTQLGLTATFFIELATAGAKEQIKTLHGMGFKIGSHTLTHPADLKAISAEECRSELETSKRMIEQLTDEPCTVLAYPRGRFNDDVVAMAKGSGYMEARTTHVLKTIIEDPMRQGGFHFFVDALIGFAKILAAFRVTNDHVLTQAC